MFIGTASNGVKKCQCEAIGVRVGGLHKVECVSSVFSGKESLHLEDEVGKTDVIKAGELHKILCRDNSSSLGSNHPYLSLSKCGGLTWLDTR